ncbi:MAG: transposase [Planctomycetota bacterium]|jgi:transposase-like protein
MARASKFTDEQRLEIALDMLSGKMSVSEVCRKWDIGSTYAYKLKDRATELLRNGIGKPAGRLCGEVERLRIVPSLPLKCVLLLREHYDGSY